MTIENPIAIHPEITEPIRQDTSESAISRLAKAQTFYTADLPREEYEKLKGDFALLGSDLLARTVVTDADRFREIGRDFEALNVAAKELMFWWLRWRVEGSVLSRAVGNDWKQKAARSDTLLPVLRAQGEQVISQEAVNKREELHLKPFQEYWSSFRWDLVGMQQDEHERHATTYVLLKGAFSDEEMIEIAKRAIQEYKLLTFAARHFYGFDFSSYSFWHYQNAYLDLIGRLAPGRLAPEKIPEEIRTGLATEFFPTHTSGVEYLAVEDSETGQRIRIHNVNRTFMGSGDYTLGDPVWYRKTDVNRSVGKLLSVGV